MSDKFEKTKCKTKGFRQLKNGSSVYVEFRIKEALPMLAYQGNFAAKNALDIEKYIVEDGPFYYCKCGGLGYVIAEKHLVHEKLNSKEEGE